MNFLAVILLSLFISVKSSYATQKDGTFHENTKTNVKSSYAATQEGGTFHENTKTNVKFSNATQEDGTFHENTKTNVKSSYATHKDGTFHENTKTNVKSSYAATQEGGTFHENTKTNVKSSNATQEDGTYHENTKTNVKSSYATQEDGTFHENTKTNVKSSYAATLGDGTFHENTKTNVKSSNATQEDGTFHENTKTNGLSGLSTVFTNDTKHEGQLTRPRRSVIEEDDNGQCYRQFFVGGKPPEGFSAGTGTNIKYICQTAGSLNTPCFSTMFDLDYKIPIYSAYVVKGIQIQPPNKFDAFSRDGKKFKPEPDIAADEQGSDEMYSNPGNLPCIHKGHLVPAQTYSFSKDHLLSTFTYTNAVPQYAAFNTGQWSGFEKKIRTFAEKCSKSQGDLYLLTGISDIQLTGLSGNTIITYQPKRMPEEPKIVIPNSMWTAGCCVSGQMALSFAVIGNNAWDKNKIFMSQVTVKDLESAIGINFLFPGNLQCHFKKNDVTNQKNDDWSSF